MIRYEEPVIRPPSEADSLILQATIGCSHNRCAFCVTYKGKRFRARPRDELYKEIDWAGQEMKIAISQTPFGNLRTHGSSGYNFGLNDRDTGGWPVHRRNEAWELLRLSRMCQVAGDQHLATLCHHGTVSARDAGYSFTVPAIVLTSKRAWMITEAAYARGFDAPRRKAYHRLVMTTTDWLYLIGTVLLIGFFFWWR